MESKNKKLNRNLPYLQPKFCLQAFTHMLLIWIIPNRLLHNFVNTSRYLFWIVQKWYSYFPEGFLFLISQLLAENKPGYIIEELCMAVLTIDLRLSKFNYICCILQIEYFQWVIDVLPLMTVYITLMFIRMKKLYL